jgi:hypothetical protein
MRKEKVVRSLTLAGFILILALVAGCSGNAGTAPPQPPLGAGVKAATPTVGQTAGCVPDDQGTDSFTTGQDLTTFALVMSRAQLSPEEDLPVNAGFENRDSQLHEGWNTRVGIAQESETPAKELLPLRGFGIRGTWFNVARMPLLLDVELFVGGEHAVPKTYVEVRTLVLKSGACASKTMAEYIGGDRVQPGATVTGFVTEERYQRKVVGGETQTSVAVYIPDHYIIWVQADYVPAQSPLSPDLAGFDRFANDAALIKQMSSPDFLDVRALTETLATKLQDQLPTSED